MKYIVQLVTVICFTLQLQSIVKDSQFKLINQEYGLNYNTGLITSDGEETVYFISGDSPSNSYKQIYSLKNGLVSKILDIEELKAISDTINATINNINYFEGKLYITANPHLFIYNFKNLERITSDLQDNYLRDIIDVEYKFGKLYFLISDNEIISKTPPNITTIIAHDKIGILEDNNLNYYSIDDSVTIDSQSTATGFTIDNNGTIWFVYDSEKSLGGGLSSFDSYEFKNYDINYYNEENSLFKTNDIKKHEGEFYISFKYNNLVDEESTGFGGFISFDLENWRLFDRSKINDNSSAHINDFLIINDENIWLAGPTLIHINPKTEEITQYKMNKIFNLPSNDYNTINSLAYNKSTNTLWFSTVFSGIGFIDNVTTDIEDEKNNAIIEYYPNPAKDVLNIKINPNVLNSEFSVGIYSIDGKLIDNIVENQSQLYIQYDTKKILSGTYFVVINTNTKKIVKKFIKY